MQTAKYIVRSFRPGSPDPVEESSARTLREARSLAYAMARRVGSSPKWVAGSRSWNCAEAVGGYDARTGLGEYTGEACAVVERRRGS